jgi:beta-galactosidase GanA
VSGIQTAIRSSSRVYTYYVERWLTELYQRVVPKMSSESGLVILVRLENEYGGFGCDHNYMTGLADLAQEHIGQDNPDQNKLNSGSLPSRAVITLNFGP